jgi:hypothetical protein
LSFTVVEEIVMPAEVFCTFWTALPLRGSFEVR